ncbi:hypothetical protein D5086_020565 [Populus alba]|uniref:Uncharacterized protein n=1 Tax=Populus alba TaxID=43335 RepID=A0ACC4BL33_POPAL
MSESHQRQMQVFGQNPNRIIDGYSEEFENEFLDMMKRSHRFSRVAATVVYNEYIHDRHHIHMNSTQWATLTEFVKYLGRTGKCKVDETPKGWFITYIDRDSETIFKSNNVWKDRGESSSSSTGFLRKFEDRERKMGGVRKVAMEVMSKALAEKGYYKQKGVVRKVIDKYVAEIEMLESKHKLRVDQEELETVIQQIGENCLKFKVCAFYTTLHEFGRFHLISKMEVIVVSSCGKDVIKRVIPFIHSALQMIQASGSHVL